MTSPAKRVAGVALNLSRKAEECRWDLVCLGEVMLRLDPGDGRVATLRAFQAWGVCY